MGNRKGNQHSVLLKAQIASVKVSSSQEREIFSDKKTGVFRTFELVNGLKFVGHIDKIKKEFSFRPLPSVFEKTLEEVHYYPSEYYKGSMFSPPIYVCSVSVKEGTPAFEREIYNQIFNPSDDFSNPELFRMKFIHHPLSLKALEILNQLNKKMPRNAQRHRGGR